MKKTRFLCFAVLALSIAGISSVQAQDKIPLWSSVDVQFYGFIKLDAAYDTQRSTPGNYVKYVESDLTNTNDDQFNMTANQTRLGLNFTGPSAAAVQTTGNFEFDFYGNGVAENKPGLLLRKAYLKLTWPEADFSILAGQDSDLISPLFPSTVSYTICWWAGNLGYRRPQIRFTKGVDLDGDASMTFAAALARTIGATASGFGPGDSGEDAGIPSIQSRIGLTFPLMGDQPTSVGVSGHWGKEEYDIDAEDNNEKFDSWSVNLDLVQPICDWLTIKGEVFAGENLSTYFGGIGQGVNVAADDEIGSQGGWLAANFTPIEDWSFTLGASMDDVRANDVADGDPTLNNTIFANAFYSINAKTQVALEVTKWHTERRQEGSADSIRTQLAFIYKF